MRALLLTALLATALLAGCADDAPTAPADASAAETADGGKVFTPLVEGSSLPRLRFGVPEFNQTATFEGSTDAVRPCPPSLGCETKPLTFDLTPLVPADAPVELALTVSDQCVNAQLSSEALFYRYSATDSGLAATLVRTSADTVQLDLYRYAFCGDPTASSFPVSVEARSVVRADVLPALMPVLLTMAPGDRLLSMGAGSDDIDDFVVVPPGGLPVHQKGGKSYNVSADGPAGDYLVLVKGGEAMLHGPQGAVMRPAPIDVFVGEERALPSGQELSWTDTVPGMPLLATLIMLSGSPSMLDPSPSYASDIALSIRQGAQELASYEESGCLPVCRLNLPTGYASTGIGTGFLPEGMGPGGLDFKASSSMSSGPRVFEYVIYVPA